MSCCLTDGSDKLNDQQTLEILKQWLGVVNLLQRHPTFLEDSLRVLPAGNYMFKKYV